MIIIIIYICDPGPQIISHKSTFFEIDIYKSYESWINKLSIDRKSVIWG